MNTLTHAPIQSSTPLQHLGPLTSTRQSHPKLSQRESSSSSNGFVWAPYKRFCLGRAMRLLRRGKSSLCAPFRQDAQRRPMCYPNDDNSASSKWPRPK
eukprot:242492-Amphidinium_carterae.1